MKKIIFLLGSIFFVFMAQARPGDGPIMPWPLDLSWKHLAHTDIEGVWLAHDAGKTLIVQIGPAQNGTSFHPVRVLRFSNGQVHEEFRGIVWRMQESFSGKVMGTADASSSQPLSIFRSGSEALTLRILSTQKVFQDLRLVRR